MITLRKKVLVLASAIMVTLALIVLPGCSKKPATGTKPAPKKDLKTGME